MSGIFRLESNMVIAYEKEEACDDVRYESIISNSESL